MARPLRMEYAGGCYHVINRGNYRRNLFYEKGAAEAFEVVLGEAAQRFGWEVHAYVIMRNHFHLAVRLGEPNLSEGMRWLQATWVRRYNRFRGLTGKPFQDRYKALVVQPHEGMRRVVDYIHLNPVRAAAVAAANLLEYRWSSLPKFPNRKRPRWLVPETVLSHDGGIPDTARGWNAYVNALIARGATEVRRGKKGRESLSRGWCVGDPGFRAQMKEQMKRRGLELSEGRFYGLEKEERDKERETSWEERLQALAAAAVLKPEAFGSKKSDPGKVLLAAAMKQSSSVSNAWLAQRLGMGEPASASQFVRRFLLQEEGHRAVQRLLAKITP